MASLNPPLASLPWHIAWRTRFLGALVRRDLEARYKSSIFGWMWPILVQLAQLLVFTYLFAAVFKVRLNVSGFANNTLAYGLWLFTGLVAWNMLQAAVIGAAPIIVGQATMVKRVVFPLALLPLVPVGSSLVEALAGYAVVIVLATIVSHHVHITVLLVPFVLVVQIILTAGLAYFVAALTVFIRDVPQMLGPLFLFTFYLTPIVYPSSSVPPSVAPYVALNPIGILVNAYRMLILEGSIPPIRPFILTATVSVVLFYAGWRFFKRVRHVFADIV